MASVNAVLPFMRVPAMRKSSIGVGVWCLGVACR
jgi:hypothetical protein